VKTDNQYQAKKSGSNDACLILLIY